MAERGSSAKARAKKGRRKKMEKRPRHRGGSFSGQTLKAIMDFPVRGQTQIQGGEKKKDRRHQRVRNEF